MLVLVRCLPLFGDGRSGSASLQETLHRHRLLQLTSKDWDWHPDRSAACRLRTSSLTLRNQVIDRRRIRAQRGREVASLDGITALGTTS